MPVPQDVRRNPIKSAVALLLSFAAGLVDVVGFISIYHVFTAHMTGTTVHLAQNLVSGDRTAAAVAAAVLAAFVLGSIFGRLIIEVAYRMRFNRVASFTLAIEAALLIAVVLSARLLLGRRADLHSLGPICMLLAMIAFAMGLQTATLTRVGVLTIHTTFVTGMLNKFAQLISHAMFRTYDVLHSRIDTEKRQFQQQQATVLRQAGFISSVWSVYLAGALCGAWLDSKWGVAAMYVAVAPLLVAIGVDQVRPLSTEEEKDQSER